MTQTGPEFFGDVWHHWVEAAQGEFDRFALGPVARRVFLDGVGQFAQTRHGLVHVEGFDVFGNTGDGAVRLGTQFEGVRFEAGRFRAGVDFGFGDQTVEAVDEFQCAFDAAFGPFDITLRRGVGQDEQTRGVGAVGGQNIIGVNDVLL